MVAAAKVVRGVPTVGRIANGAIIEREIELDGNAHQNLATFCSTWEPEEVMKLMAASINKNLIDKDEYPQAAEIERRCVHMLADLWNAPDAHDAVGTSAIGSSDVTYRPACQRWSISPSSPPTDTSSKPRRSSTSTRASS